MAQRKGETQRQYMDRLRAVRGLPPMDAGNVRDQMMSEVAAARCYVDRAVSNPQAQAKLEMHAFMSIFHPEVPAETVRQMAYDAGDLAAHAKTVAEAMTATFIEAAAALPAPATES